jgi:hypothetical protein
MWESEEEDEEEKQQQPLFSACPDTEIREHVSMQREKRDDCGASARRRRGGSGITVLAHDETIAARGVHVRGGRSGDEGGTAARERVSARE